MALYSEISHSIRRALGEKLYDPVDVRERVNLAVRRIAGGVKLPDGRVSPPLPDLMSTATVSTVLDTEKAPLPTNYDRNVIYITDANDDHIPPPNGGDYYSFNMFLRRASKKDLSETGTVYMACIKGAYLYYQGIPSTSKDLLVYYYRKPTDMASDDDEPDGIPEAHHINLIKQLVLSEVYGDTDGKGHDAKEKRHLRRFYDHVDEMMQYVGEQEGEPVYYHHNEELIQW